MEVSHYRATREPSENQLSFANVHNSLVARRATEKTNSSWIQATIKWKTGKELFLYFSWQCILFWHPRLRYIKLWRYNFLCKIRNRLFYNTFMLKCWILILNLHRSSNHHKPVWLNWKMKTFATRQSWASATQTLNLRNDSSRRLWRKSPYSMANPEFPKGRRQPGGGVGKWGDLLFIEMVLKTA